MDNPAVPSASLLAQLVQELQRHAPFAQMQAEELHELLAAASQAYYAPGELVLGPEQGPVGQLCLLRQGAVSAQRGLAETAGGFHYEAGEMFPIAALLGQRPVTASYRSQGDSFCLLIPAATVQAVARRSAVFADFLNRRVAQFLALSRRAVQVAYASQTLAEQSLETPLAQLLRGAPVSVAPETPLHEALALMEAQRVGSLLVADAEGRALGILTRHDLLSRIVLPRLPLDTPIAAVMSQPVLGLQLGDTAQDAALLMSQHGLRHVPVLDGERLVGMVSERDLFALQRLSLKQVSSAIRAADSVDTLKLVAQDIRRFARNLLAQGVAARQLTELVSHLNDVLTQRLLQLVAAARGVDMGQVCWLAFGSEGRSEQTLATDQDNGLIFVSAQPDADRPRWMAFAREVNEALDACGYPLCKGGIMASEPACCRTPQEWLRAFNEWMEHGAPEDLLQASIYFDFRPLAGDAELARPLRELLGRHGAALPRFLRQLGENALRSRPPLNWLGALEGQTLDGREGMDLKLQGTALFVDAARLFALAHGLTATGTRARLEAAARLMQVPATESEGWVGAFEFLQMLRLRGQLEGGADGAANPNWIAFDTLNDVDRRMLKECCKLARRLQQRIELDWLR
jgi:CBS domain-containing protein